MALLKGFIFGAVGFVLGAAIVGLIRTGMGLDFWSTDLSWSIAYPVALIGWLIGVGGWKYWATEWFGGTAAESPKGVSRYFEFNMDHKVIGIQYGVTFIILLLLSGLFAMFIRYELMRPGLQLFTEDQYNAIMSFHGIGMIAVAVAIMMGAFGNYIVPIQIGARDMAFPRINALSYWLVPPVAVTLVIALLMGGWDSGWTAYPPLSVLNKSGQVLFNLAVATFGITSILGGLNFIATIVYERAPGMTWGRLPIFVWGCLAGSFIAFFFTQGFAAALLMVLLDRVAGTTFFGAAGGGSALLYQHTFWFYSHPAVYVMVVPAFGAALEVLSHMSKKPLYAYKWTVGAFLGIVGLSGLVWAHHMFTSGMADYLHAPFLVLTELISIPTGVIFLSAIGTIWMGRLWMRTPMLFALMFVFNFTIGGLTGIYLADVPTDLHLHDTYFVVAHFHYTIMGGEIFALFAALYYWFPKMTGREYNETLGRIHAILMFIGFQATFIPLFQVGVQGMNRRIADYPAAYETLNMYGSFGAYLLGSSFIFFTANMILSWVRGKQAAANPWGASTLEWEVASPPPPHNFDEIPVIESGPYEYGTGSPRTQTRLAGAGKQA